MRRAWWLFIAIGVAVVIFTIVRHSFSFLPLSTSYVGILLIVVGLVGGIQVRYGTLPTIDVPAAGTGRHHAARVGGPSAVIGGRDC